MVHELNRIKLKGKPPTLLPNLPGGQTRVDQYNIFPLMDSASVWLHQKGSLFGKCEVTEGLAWGPGCSPCSSGGTRVEARVFTMFIWGD